jgi:hypothetical protein
LRGAYQASGIRGFAEKQMELVRTGHLREVLNPQELNYQAGLFDKDQWFASLEKRFVRREPTLPFIKVNPGKK